MSSTPEALLTPTDAPDLFDLFDAVLDDRGDADVRRMLGERLSTDQAVRDSYAAYVGIHAELAWQHRGSVVAASDQLVQRTAQRHVAHRSQISARRRTFRLVRFASAACMLILVITYLLYSATYQTAPQQGPAPLAATISRTFTAEWSDGQSHGLGSAIATGRHVLQFGEADLILPSGVVLTLHAPCDLDLTAENRVGLSLGMLTAQVPTSARGFTVQVPHGTVVDHGTIFTTLVEADGGAEVHVLNGEVVVEMHSGAGSATTHRLHTGQALRRSGTSGTSEAILFNPSLGGQRLGVHGVAQTSSSVRLIEPAPPSVAPGALESDQRIALIRERQAMATTAPMRVAMPARIDGSEPEKLVTLMAQTRVDSYLLHFDPVGSPTQAAQVIGSVTFDHPVVGIFTIDPHLVRSQKTFGHPTMTYHEQGVRQGIESEDSVTLSADGRTLRIVMSVREQQTDQIRVLVAHPP